MIIIIHDLINDLLYESKISGKVFANITQALSVYIYYVWKKLISILKNTCFSGKSRQSLCII